LQRIQVVEWAGVSRTNGIGSGSASLALPLSCRGPAELSRATPLAAAAAAAAVAAANSAAKSAHAAAQLALVHRCLAGGLQS
jgi:hypothetical protein